MPATHAREEGNFRGALTALRASGQCGRWYGGQEQEASLSFLLREGPAGAPTPPRVAQCGTGPLAQVHG